MLILQDSIPVRCVPPTCPPYRGSSDREATPDRIPSQQRPPGPSWQRPLWILLEETPFWQRSSSWQRLSPPSRHSPCDKELLFGQRPPYGQRPPSRQRPSIWTQTPQNNMVPQIESDIMDRDPQKEHGTRDRKWHHGERTPYEQNADISKNITMLQISFASNKNYSLTKMINVCVTFCVNIH